MNVSSARWRVHHEQDHDHADQHQRRLEQRRQPVGDQLVERLDVVGQARDDHPGAVARVEADRQRLQVLEQLDPQVLQRALADPADEVGLRVGGDPYTHRRGEERDDDQSSAPTSWLLMPSSIASFASGAGASAAPVAATSETNIASTRQRYGASSSTRPRSLRRARRSPAGAREPARRRGGFGGHSRGAHSPTGDRPAGTPGRAVPSRRSRGTAASARAAPRGADVRDPAASRTTISSASAIVESRWAITNVVRPAITSRSARLICCSVEASTDEVASSRIRIRGSARIARAIAIRWRWPPERVSPRSPTSVS
jgi:hypothetical protein